MLLTRTKCLALFLSVASMLCLAVSIPSFAQDWQRGGPGGPMERSFRGPEHGRWWDNPQVAQQLGLTDAQKKQMDDILQQSKLQLIDLNAALEKQEVILRPMIQADQPDEQKVLNQIDAVAQARANLEKANARMLFAIRRVLTPDQWKKVQTMAQNRRAMMGRGMRSGHRGWDGPNGPKGPGGPGGPDGPGSNGQPAPPPPPPAPADQ
jgi:periplasmic protein CpxP/Spy